MEPGATAGPRVEYERRLEARRRALARLERRDRTFSSLRLGLLAIAAAFGLLVAAVPGLSAAWLFLLLAVFIGIVIAHAWTVRMRDCARLAVAHYETALGRLDHSWQGKGIPGGDFESDDHPYAADLDLFGRASLFELLCTARTRAGEEMLASWLLRPAQPGVVRQRQEAVAELAPLLDLREEIGVLAGGLRSTIHPESLTRWGSAAAVFGGRSLLSALAAAWILGAVACITAGLWVASLCGPMPFLAVVLAEWITGRILRGRLQKVVAAVTAPGRELPVLISVLGRLERQPFRSARLAALKLELLSDGQSAVKAIRRLDRLVSWLEFRRNALFAPLGFLLMWTLHFALMIESWRLRFGPRIARWLDALGEFEALGSLACYAYERPGDTFPRFIEEAPAFLAEGLGHPLIREGHCVRNSVRLDGKASVLIVSGSNMSGKSTLLRAVGVNAVLAHAGAPVRCGSMSLSPLVIGATIRLKDSIQEGQSRFYAEIRRLKMLMDMAAGGRSLLFLLDEVLHGTNSNDRRAGASALLRQLIRAGAIGLVTTHDLAIADAAPDMGGAVRNVHFTDRLEDGKLLFDYRIREGVVTRTNAIELMRSVGLKV